ncbi:MAG TPA: SWIM zinc finger family protein [Acidimicrobiales bacterium]
MTGPSSSPIDPARQARLADIRERITGLDEARRLARDRARRQGRKPSGRTAFGTTWWGRAWIDALEHRARLDPNRLPRGRSYARRGKVGALVVDGSGVRAPVYGTQMSAYRVWVRVRAFSDDEWGRAIDAIAAKAGHAAALLDGELAPEIVDDLAGVGLSLLPGPGEVGTTCSCPDWANPCKHAAAVCYLMAELLDREPFSVLQLRGRPREEVLAGLRARRAAEGPAAATTGSPRLPATVTARSLAGRVTGPLPRLPLPPARAGRPAPLLADPPPRSGVSAAVLATLCADAARRALQLANGEGDGGLGLSFEQDLARRAEPLIGTPAFPALAGRAGVAERRLLRTALAWRYGGLAGLAVLDDRWDPPAGALDEARAALIAAGLGVRPRITANAAHAGLLQLRLGRDGAWYRLERRAGGWDLVAPPAPDPDSLLDV